MSGRIRRAAVRARRGSAGSAGPTGRRSGRRCRRGCGRWRAGCGAGALHRQKTRAQIQPTPAGRELPRVATPATGLRRPDTPAGGSVARGEDTDNSDIDLLVDLDTGVGIVSLAGLTRELAELLDVDVDVDVVPAATLKPAVRDEVLGEAITL